MRYKTSEASYLEINNNKVVKIVKTDNFSLSQEHFQSDKKNRVSVLTILTTLSLLTSFQIWSFWYVTYVRKAKKLSVCLDKRVS